MGYLISTQRVLFLSYPLIISLVTLYNLEKFTNPVVNYHESELLINIRELEQEIKNPKYQNQIQKLPYSLSKDFLYSVTKESKLEEIISNKHKLQSYLKKFSYRYQFFKLRKYPNDLSTISNKKMNDLGLASLFILSGI